MGIYDTPPTTRADCINQPRPCPWIRCKHHMIWACMEFKKKSLYGWNKKNHRKIKVTDNNILKTIFSLKYTCVLDVADMDEITLQDVGDILGVSRERIRQIEDWKNDKRGKMGALQKLRLPKRLQFFEGYGTKTI